MADSKVFNLEQGMTVMQIAQGLDGFLSDNKGLISEIVETPQGIIVQAKQKEAWKKFIGMDNSVQVQLFDQGSTVIVNVGSGKWIDKAGAGVAGVLVFAPLAVTAAIGAWAGKKLPKEIFDFIEQFILTGGRTASVSMRMNNALKSDETLCPKCNTANATNTKFCNSCGEKLIIDCPKCGEAVLPGIKFCQSCGTNVSEAVQQEKADSVVNCQKCGTTIPDGVKFCPECGTEKPVQLEPGTARCPACKKIVPETTKFCPDCGGNIPQKAIPTCPKCGKTASEGVKFCPECGSAMKE